MPEPVDVEGISQEVLDLASWSEWVPLADAEVPQMPGVYLAKRGAAGPLVYVGTAGERQGEGLRGRLRRYTSGKALASGLGEAVFDLALADPQSTGSKASGPWPRGTTSGPTSSTAPSPWRPSGYGSGHDQSAVEEVIGRTL